MSGKLAFKVPHTYNPALCVNACSILAETYGVGRSALALLLRREAWGRARGLGTQLRASVAVTASFPRNLEEHRK
jgi:hypothetical protein